MFQTEGPLGPESPLFVGRESALAAMSGWIEQGTCVGALAGARQTGKTSTLFRLCHSLQDRYGLVYVDLESVYECDASACFCFICEVMLRDLRDRIPEHAGLEPATTGVTFQQFLRRTAEMCQAVRIGLILDEIGAPCDDAINKLATTIRAVVTSGRSERDRALARYSFVLSGSTDMKKFANEKVSPLQNYIVFEWLRDLTVAEVIELLRRGFVRYGLQLDEDVGMRIWHWTGGHPYWTQLTGREVAERCRASGRCATRQDVDAAVDRLVSEESKNLAHMRRTLNKGSPRLRRMLGAVLRGDHVRYSRWDEELVELDLAGAITVKDGACVVRNRLFERAMAEWPEVAQPWGVGPDVPSGTVTFLVTDIVASSTLWERFPRAVMEAVVARHNRIIEESVVRHSGVVFKSLGDGLLASFREASAAVNAAIAAQVAVAGEDWSRFADGFPPLKVKIGIHTGEAAPGEAEEVDYIGRAVNRLCRIVSLARGGEILLSSSASEIAREHLPDGWNLQFIGRRKLKGLRTLERICKLVRSADGAAEPSDAEATDSGAGTFGA